MSSIELPPRPPNRDPATVRIAMWSARHRWPVAALWFLATIGLFVGSLAMGGINAGDPNSNPNDKQLEARRGVRRLQGRRHERPVRAVHRQSSAADPAPPPTQASRRRSATWSRRCAARTHPSMASRRRRSTRSSTHSRPPRRLGWSPRTGRPSAWSAGSRATTRRSTPSSNRCCRSSTRLVPRTPSLTIHLISSTFINQDINELISSGLDGSLRLTMPLTFLILLVAFGAIVAAVVPLVLAITSLLAAFGMLGIYSQVVGSGQRQCQPAHRPDRAGGRGRLLAVHGHPLPGRATGRPRSGDSRSRSRAAPPVARSSSRASRS